MENDATNELGRGSKAFQTSDNYADELYNEALTLYNSSYPRGPIIDMISRAKPKLSKCSPASTQGIAAFFAALLQEKYDGETSVENLDTLHQALQWNLAVDEENLEVHAKVATTLWNKYKYHSPGFLDEATVALSDFAAKFDRVISPFVEGAQERHSGRSEESSSKEATHSDPTAILRSYGPAALKAMHLARMFCLFIHEERYSNANEYTITSLDDLIGQAEAAVTYFEASKRLGLEYAGGDDEGLAYTEALLSRALAARLFRYSFLESAGIYVAEQLARWDRPTSGLRFSIYVVSNDSA